MPLTLVSFTSDDNTQKTTPVNEHLLPWVLHIRGIMFQQALQYGSNPHNCGQSCNGQHVQHALTNYAHCYKVASFVRSMRICSHAKSMPVTMKLPNT
jgi:hypothetical protein